MKGRWRLILVWGVVAAWVGWLGWQAAKYGKFPVVSRAQLLTAKCVVVATVTTNNEGLPQPDVKIVAILTNKEGEPPPVGEAVRIIWAGEEISGPGDYVMPLVGPNPYRIAPMPRSPLGPPSLKGKVYRDAPVVREQVVNRP